VKTWDRPDIQDLIENSVERLDVELKDWIDIANDLVARAKIARHIAALANHGGGYLVFGFRDDLSPNSSLPFPLQTFERDSISSIVRKYLTPMFQCDVNLLTGSVRSPHKRFFTLNMLVSPAWLTCSRDGD
jgi:predicted HTH transcriptional regulator